jgi:hypothetical protein
MLTTFHANCAKCGITTIASIGRLLETGKTLSLFFGHGSIRSSSAPIQAPAQDPSVKFHQMVREQRPKEHLLGNGFQQAVRSISVSHRPSQNKCPATSKTQRNEEAQCAKQHCPSRGLGDNLEITVVEVKL